MTTSDDDDDDDKTGLLDPQVMLAQARVGRVLKGKYHLDVLIGVGGMAAVYAATHRNGSRVAIKILHPELSVSADIRTRFLREGYAANAVSHDGVVRVADDDTAEDGSAFLVMELLDGETLEDRRHRCEGRLGEDEVLSVADQLVDVLIAAHAKGIIHRDLKPENVFLTRDGRVKVLDFGIARLREASATSHATRAGSSMGTPAFMAPEQARGLWDEVDGRSDLWAVGATLFNLLSGATVHSGRTANEVLIEAATKPAPPLASVMDEVSPAVARLVDKALAFEREQRWPDAATMQAAVRTAFHDRHGSPISSAAKLAVPPSVADRTLASAQAPSPVSPRAQTTNGAVASSLLDASPPRLPVSPATRFHGPGAIAIGVAAVVGTAIGVGVLVSSGSKGPAASGSSVTTIFKTGPEPAAARVASSSQASPPAQPPEPIAAPVIAVTDLPMAMPQETSKKPATKVQIPSPAAPTPPAKAAKPNCSPPYVLDPATGAKKWKPECF